MTDREYLQLAAKAAGGQVRFDLSPDEAPWLQSVVDGKPQPYPARWNPLTDSGQALELAVKLRLCVGPNFHGDRAVCFRDDREDVRELFGNDPLAATRRAIVRAAAEIGRSMK